MSRKHFGRHWKRSRKPRRSDGVVTRLEIVGGTEAPISTTEAYQRYVDAQAKVFTYTGTEDVTDSPELALERP